MTIADLDRVMEIAAGLRDAPHWPRSAYREAVARIAGVPRIALVAVEEPAAVEGFAVASLVAPQAELESIAVAALSQRSGLGRKLIDALAGELRRAGIREVLLEVRASNDAALSFYRRLGFADAGRRKGYYADPIEDAVQMKLSLD
jgi:ribosomal-protein-alanine N-acetyltransferase